MFEKNKIRISELQAQISSLDQRVREHHTRAKALQHSGERAVGQFPKYFESFLAMNSRKFNEVLSKRPLRVSLRGKSHGGVHGLLTPRRPSL